MRIGSATPPRLSYEQHFQYGYNGTPFSFRTTTADRWFVRYGRCGRAIQSFRDECRLAAVQIRKSTQLPIDLLFSGGVDSEVALRAFLMAGVEVRVSTVRFEGGHNAHDLEWVDRVCGELGVRPRYFDLDLFKFWNGEAFEYAERTQCVSPQLLTTMWLADQTDGFVVLGSGENFIVKEVPSDYVSGVSPYPKTTWHLFEKEKVASWYRHFQVRGRDAAPGFFQYTPEIMLSWFLDPMAMDLWNDRLKGKLSSASSKLPIYQRHFSIAERPKFTGFEKVMKEAEVFRKELRRHFDDCDFIVKTPVPQLVKALAVNDDEWRSRGLDLSSITTDASELIDGRIYYE